jgi:hypothetical protein
MPAKNDTYRRHLKPGEKDDKRSNNRKDFNGESWQRDDQRQCERRL